MTTIVLPSGLAGRIKPLDIESCSLLADNPPETKRLALAEQLFSNSWVETTDPGPYKEAGRLKKDGSINWRKVLMGDRMALLLELRILTWGPEFRVTIPCPTGSCARRTFTRAVDLRKDLKWQKLSDAGRAALIAGNRCEVMVGPKAEAERIEALESDDDLADAWQEGNMGAIEQLADWGSGELKVWFKLPDGDWSRKALQLSQYQKVRRLMIALSWRIAELHDGEGQKVTDVLTFLRTLHARYLGAMIRAFDTFDCGIDNTITGECPECYAEYAQTVPFEKHFFLPALADTRGAPRAGATFERSLSQET